MRFTKNTNLELVILGAVLFAAGLVQADVVAQKWVARYNGPGNGDDSASGIAVDGSGNVYVTGFSYGSGTGMDYATIKCDTNGNQKWVARYNGPGNGDDSASGLAVDGSGNVYVTGYSYGSGTQDDYATIKYDTNGNQIWVSRYNGPANWYDRAVAIALDGSGNVYVTGYSDGVGTLHDYATIKYDPNGNQLWAARYNGPANEYDEAYAIALDGSGNVYVTGRSDSEKSVTIKYDPNGNQQWVTPTIGNFFVKAIALDGLGKVYVTGCIYESAPGEIRYLTIKYDPNGNQIWEAFYSNEDLVDRAYAIALDGSGNAYVTGETGTSTRGDDYGTVKYDPNGNQIWAERYDGPGNSDDDAGAIAVDGSGNVYVTGFSYGSDTGKDYATIKYTQHPVILTMQTEPIEVNTVTPALGEHEYAEGIAANISAERFVDCPDVYVFGHWVGDVNDINAASTTVVMDTDKTVTAVFVDGRQCGDECHPYPAGDVNKDCKVDFFDIAVVANNWLVCTDPNCD